MNQARRFIRSLQGERLDSRRMLAADVSVTIDQVPAEVEISQELDFVVTLRNEGDVDAVAEVQIPSLGLEQFEWSKAGPHSFPRVADLGELDGRNGFSFEGGVLASSAGDINADGYGDIVFQRDYEATDSFVLFGGPGVGGAGSVLPTDLNGTNGFVIQNVETGDYSGSVGDINGDGVDDLLVGAHVILGQKAVGSAGVIDTKTADATVAFRVTMASLCEDCLVPEIEHAPAGDVNGDGFDDLVVSYQFYPKLPRDVGPDIFSEGGVGAAWVLFGSPTIGRSPVDLSELDGTNGFRIQVDTGDLIQFGHEVLAAGDMNVDGFDDFMVMDCNRQDWEDSSRYLIYGGAAIGSSGELRIDPWFHQGVPKVRYNCFHLENEILSDVNADGLPDLVAAKEVLFGREGGIRVGFDRAGKVDIPSTPELGAELPFAPLAIGDFNGDSKPDYVFRNVEEEPSFGWLQANEFQRDGALFVSLNGMPSAEFDFEFSAVNGSDNFLIRGPGPIGEPFRYTLVDARVGDFNGDGIDDLAIATDKMYFLFGNRRFPTFGAGSVQDEIELPAGAQVEYRLRGTVGESMVTSLIPNARVVTVTEDGELTNIEVTGAEIRVDANEIAAEVDLRVQIDNGRKRVFPNEQVETIVTVSNVGSTGAVDANLIVELHDNLRDIKWRTNGGADKGVGEIDQRISLAPNEARTYTLVASGGRQVGNFQSSVRIEPNALQTDLNPGDNVATDSDESPLRYQVPEVLGAHGRSCFNETVEFRGALYFATEGARPRSNQLADDACSKIHKTDGSIKGTRLSSQTSNDANWNPNDGITNPEFVVFRDAIYFAGADEVHGEELWRFDGTYEGTKMVADIDRRRTKFVESGEHQFPTAGIDNLLATDDWLLFMADDNLNGRELWRSDGTRAGTELVRDINIGAQSSLHREANANEVKNPHDPARAIVFESEYYFVADDGIHGRELWRSDGTEAGTEMVVDLSPGDSHSFPFAPGDDPNITPRFQEHDGALYFYANDEELWRTDGTEAGTLRAEIAAVPSPVPTLRYGDYEITHENGFFYRSPIDSQERQLIAQWSAQDRQRIDWMRVLGDRLVFVATVASTSSSREIDNGLIYAFDLDTDDFNIRLEKFDASGSLMAGPSNLVRYVREPQSSNTVEVEAESGHLIELIDPTYQPTIGNFASIANLNDASDARRRTLNLSTGDSITVAFPKAIQDRKGNDVEVGLRDSSFRVEGIGVDGVVYDFGIVDRDNANFDVDAPIASLRFSGGRGGFPFASLHSLNASIEASHVFTVDATNNPDFEFAWDLDGDGQFDDRQGKSIGLTDAELLAFGLLETEMHSVSVRINDRVNDYVFSALVPIYPSAGDVDLDGHVGIEDFRIIARNFQQFYMPDRSDGDLNGDGLVDFLDFLVFANHVTEPIEDAL